jgi:TonB family protein
MTTPETPTTVPQRAPEPQARGVVSSGWLSSSGFDADTRQPRRLAGAMGISVSIQGLVLILLIVGIGIKQAQTLIEDQDKPKFVFLQDPGPGGGGGGSPAPAPPKPMEIPHHQVQEVPITPIPIVVPLPIPTLNAPVETTAADILQATGSSAVSLASYGGGGRGGGIGSGTGNGVGPGTGGGFGGGAFRPGSGLINPVPIRQVEPKYTSEAMRAKITGEVHLEVVVKANGTVGDVRVIQSLDDKYGLDEEAKKAAKQWLFTPGNRLGVRVDTIVTLILTFRLH